MPKVLVESSSVKARVRIRIGLWWFSLRGESIFFCGGFLGIGIIFLVGNGFG